MKAAQLCDGASLPRPAFARRPRDGRDMDGGSKYVGVELAEAPSRALPVQLVGSQVRHRGSAGGINPAIVQACAGIGTHDTRQHL